MVTRIVIINSEVYRISEAKFKKIHFKMKPEQFNDNEEYRNAKADIVRKHGKHILTADEIFRTD